MALQIGDDSFEVADGSDRDVLRFAIAKAVAINEFERSYLRTLMDRCDGNLSFASRESGIARHYLRLLLKKHGLYVELKADSAI
jgi:DNA-binding protein Fis